MRKIEVVKTFPGDRYDDQYIARITLDESGEIDDYVVYYVDEDFIEKECTEEFVKKYGEDILFRS